jgi:hypothetical protein
MRYVNEADIIIGTPSGHSVGLTHYLLICALASPFFLYIVIKIWCEECVSTHHSSEPTHRLNPGYGVSRDDNHQKASKMG